MKMHPLIPVALAYLAGLLLGDVIQFPLGWLFVITFAAGAAWVLARSARPFLLWPFLVLFGWTNLAWRTEIVSPHDLRLIVDERAEYVTLHGRLREVPRERIFLRNEMETRRSSALLQVTALRRDGEWEPAVGRVLITTPDSLGDQGFPGQIAEVTGVIAPPPGAVAENLFDYRRHLQRRGVYHLLRVERVEDWQFEGEAAGEALWPARFQRWARTQLARGLPEEDQALRLLWAMTLGWKAGLTEEVSEPFMRSGTMHLFAISGLHIGLITTLLVAVLRLSNLPRPVCAAIALPLLWLYAAATGWQPSAVRATIMASVILAGWILKRPGDLLNSLSAAGLIILLWEPQQLFQASFQLSFSVVLSLALLLPHFERARQRLLKTDPMRPDELRPPWQRWLDRPVRWVTVALAATLAAWLGSLPLIACYFHLFTPVSLLANLLIVPLGWPLLMSALCSLLLGGFAGPVSDCFNHSAWFFMKIMIALSNWAAELPAAWFFVPAPSALALGLYYGLLFTILNGWLLAPGRRRWALAVVAVTCLSGCWKWNGARHDVELTVFGLSAGDALFVNAPGRAQDLLVDCGDAHMANMVIKPFLRAHGLKQLPTLLLTHGDMRHVAGAELLRQEFAAGDVITSPLRFRSTVYRKLVERLEQEPEHWRKVQRGDTLQQWQVLHPAAEERVTQADDGAVVLKGNLHGAVVLLISDLGREGQRRLLERETDLRADILIGGMPARDEPMGEALLEAVQPRMIILSDPLIPAPERASAALRARLAARGIPVFYTSRAGSVKITFRPGGWAVKTMN